MENKKQELQEKLEQLKSRIDRLDSFKSIGIDAGQVYNSNINKEVK